jgi:hypothetical protein
MHRNNYPQNYINIKSFVKIVDRIVYSHFIILAFSYSVEDLI